MRQGQSDSSIPFERIRLVGAVGIENNNGWNFRDLGEMLGSAKALKKNNRELKGILIGPLKAPRFLVTDIPSSSGFVRRQRRSVGSGPKFRGMDGKPTNATSTRLYSTL
jgi:hypothetical protein